MTLTPAKKGGSYDPVPSGNHIARLYEIIHVGTIPTQWQGQDKMTDKIRLGFELCNEKKEFRQGEGEKPYSISREFTYSWGQKGHLRPFIEGFIGTKLHDDEAYNFNLEDLLGEACLLNVVHTEKDGNTYANIQGASPLPKGLAAPALVNEKRSLDINSIPYNEIDALPEFIQKKMKSSEEYSARLQVDNDPVLAAQKVKNFRPKSAEPVIEYPTDEPNPDDVPF
jgi:hypothetical protein